METKGNIKCASVKKKKFKVHKKASYSLSTTIHLCSHYLLSRWENIPFRSFFKLLLNKICESQKDDDAYADEVDKQQIVIGMDVNEMISLRVRCRV